MIVRAGIFGFAVFLAVLAGRAEAQQGWRIEEVPSFLGISRGTACSIAVDAGGLPHIAYLELTNEALYYVRRDPAEGWRQEFSAIRHAEGTDVALKLDVNGRPRIAYTDPEFSARPIPRLLVAENLAGEWTVDELTGRLVHAMSMDLEKELDPFIAYSDYDDNQSMHIARRRDGQWMLSKVTNNAVSATATAVDVPRGVVHIVYIDVTHRAVKHASLSAGRWQFETIEILTPAAILLNTLSLTLDSEGQPVAAYAFEGRIRVAQRVDGVWRIQFVPEEGAAGDPVIQVDRRNNLHLAYARAHPTQLNQLRYARTRAGAWQLETVDEQAPYGLSFVLDRGGSAHLAYLFHDGLRQLRYATNRPAVGLPATE
jgi:hypothetical protein